MKEISEHSIYDLLKGKYSDIGCDYVILAAEGEYRGVESHREAVICAWEILNRRYSPYDICFDLEADKMKAVASSIDELLELPADDIFPKKGRADRSYSVDAPIPYRYAFLEPPHGTPYRQSDFLEFNAALFPNRDGIEVFRWNDDFSDYFDAGKEWWGTGLWSAFDPNLGRFVVIGASMTD